VVDTATDKVTGTIDVGLAPQSVAITPDGSSLVVTGYDAVSIVDVHSGLVRSRLADHGRAHGVAVTPDGKQAWIVDTRNDAVVVIDVKRGRTGGRINVGNSPWNVAIRPDGAVAYVTNANSDTVSVIDTARLRVTGTVATDHVPTGITATADTVWLTTNASSTVQSFDSRRCR
jgi:phospholipase C